MLRFMIHMMGDFHQPLHVTARCTPKMPQCDAGGNKFPIQGMGKYTNELHALWDQAMGFIPFEKRVFISHAANCYYSHCRSRRSTSMKNSRRPSPENTADSR